MAIRLTIMDRAMLWRDDVPVRLEPRFMGVLIRLALDLGSSVRMDDLSQDVLMARGYGLPLTGAVAKDKRQRRLHVYKSVSVIRMALDPDHPGEASTMLVADRGNNPGYRLELPSDSVDALRFERLVRASRTAPPVRAVSQLRQALGLWCGRPLVDVEHHEWARPHIIRVTEAHDEARLRLLELYETFDRTEAALDLGRALFADHPEDTALRDRLARLSAQQKQNATQMRYETGWSGCVITIRVGDLLDQDDAHLVVGFTDAFDTNTADDHLISRASIQGQLLHRYYEDDYQQLDRELRKALRDAPRKVERRESKRYGKLSRYPVGTVAVLSQGGRRIFCVAYSRVDKQGIYAQSSVPRLRIALDRLWKSVRSAGQHRPVAMGVLGSGLARINETDKAGLIQLIVRSFLVNQARARLADELRIIVHPKDAAALDMELVDEAITFVINESLPP
jgi:hypothetical protein